MQNQHNWRPSKFVYRNGRLKASRNVKDVGAGSRLIADIIARFFEENIKKYVKGKLLDLGCGNVPLYHAYREYVTDNICVDWKNTLHRNEFLDFECDLTKPLPFDNGEFDTIILSDVLEHIPNPDHLWNEMSRVLAEGGIIIISVPFYYWLHERPNDFYRYTESALRRFVENSNLTLVRLEPLGGSPEIIADIFAKHVQFVPMVGRGLAIGIQYVTWLFIQTSLGKKISETTSEVFPFGYFLIVEKRYCHQVIIQTP
jgi:SAM-dependent methyltransferase